MPKILRIINRFNLGGPTFNAAYLTKYLAPQFETLLIGGIKDDSEASSEFILEKLGVSFRILNSMKRSINPVNDIFSYIEIKKIIKEFKPDIVHTHAAKAGAIGRQAAIDCKVPVIVHTYHGHVFHSYFGDIKTFFFKSIERQLAKKTTAIIAISEKQKQELAIDHAIAPEEKFSVIPLGFDLSKFQEDNVRKRESFRAKYNIKEEEIAIGIIGRLAPIKNHNLFFEAIRFLTNNTSKKIKAIIIGDGEERVKLEALVQEFRLENIVIFTSWIKDIDTAYPGLDIVCLTSFNEGTPVSLIEAQAANKPIVSTRVGGIEDVVSENKTALLSEINDKSKFFNNLLRLSEDRALRDAFSKEGWDFVKEKYHYIRLINDFTTLYSKLLG